MSKSQKSGTALCIRAFVNRTTFEVKLRIVFTTLIPTTIGAEGVPVSSNKFVSNEKNVLAGGATGS